MPSDAAEKYTAAKAEEKRLAARAAERAPRDEQFGRKAFQSFKANDFDSLMTLLPKPPFVISLNNGGKRETIDVSAGQFAELTTGLRDGFTSIIAAFAAQGVQPRDLALAKITVSENSLIEAVDSEIPVNIYLLLATPKGRYQIRLEDCISVGDKYLPEQL